MPQDMPPTGGYNPVQYKRNLPSRGPRASVYLLAMFGICGYGFYKYGVGVREQNEYARERLWARIHLMPLLQAEEDRDVVRRVWADQEREKELLGSITKPYNSDRFVRPTYTITPEKPLQEK